MPIYDYTCTACRHLVEVIHGMSEPGPRFCPNCGAEGTMRKGFATPAIHYKGSGWAKKDRSATVSSGRSQGGKAAGSADHGDASPDSGTGEQARKSDGSASSGASDSGGASEGHDSSAASSSSTKRERPAVTSKSDAGA